MDNLALVNFVIQESGNEQNLLDIDSWDQPAAGRRIYPRIKRYVSQAWEEIQMSRDQWEFMTDTMYVTLGPRIRSVDFDNSTWAPDDVYVGAESGFTFSIGEVFIDTELGFFDIGIKHVISGANPVVGETFSSTDNTDTFTYLGPATYNIIEGNGVASVRWETFAVRKPLSSIVPMNFVPWEDMLALSGNYSYSDNTSSTPAYVAQDPIGWVAFYPQLQNEDGVTFSAVVKYEPDIWWDDSTNSSDPEAVPLRLPESYHKWIGWEALMKLALYDKNQQLYNYANKHAMFYRKRAENNLMPLMRWNISL